MKIWYKDGECHREDGPAFECDLFVEWWLGGVRYTFDDYCHKIPESMAIYLKMKYL